MWWFLIISLLILLYYIWQKLRSLGKKYPMCLPHLPILGSLIYLKSHEETHIYFTKLKEKYGQIYAFWLGSYYVVVVNHFSLAKEVLLKKGKEFACRPQMEKFDIDSVNNLLDMMLKAKINNNGLLTQESEITDKHILMTVGDIFGAGVETSSSVIKWSIAYMLHYPQVQETIQKEIDQKIGFTRTPVLSDRHQLPFLEATVREVLRIRPVAPLLIPHVARTDTSIGEYTIPKDTRIYINLWSIHHDPTEWDEPEQFKPERFLDKNKEQLIMPTASYFPFGGGPRTCIGEFLARAELFLFLSWILQRFDLEVADDGKLPSLEGKFAMVFQILPFKLKFKLRKAWREAQLSA
uniref:Steroid 17-alpha-hydroxylase/17,20 lyase n=1 Tax=Vombatus ursinus TaxID=29139 RepID=A0A4X2JQ35_VOMUR